MYKTQKITKKELQAVVIKDQKEILRLMGKQLSPLLVWEIIKEKSQNFSKSVAKALEADSLLHDVLNLKRNQGQGQENQEKPKSQANTKKRKMSLERFYRFRANSRARELELLTAESLTAA